MTAGEEDMGFEEIEGRVEIPNLFCCEKKTNLEKIKVLIKMRKKYNKNFQSQCHNDTSTKFNIFFIKPFFELKLMENDQNVRNLRDQNKSNFS